MTKQPESDSPQAPKRKKKKVELRLDEDLHRQANEYAKQHGSSLGAVIRALLRFWTDPRDPRPLPPDVDKEKKRPPRAQQKKRTRKKPKSDDA